jgi:hypothetical protein
MCDSVHREIVHGTALLPYAHGRVYVCVCVRVYQHTAALDRARMHTYMYIYVYVYIYSKSLCGIYIYIYIYISACICICILFVPSRYASMCGVCRNLYVYVCGLVLRTCQGFMCVVPSIKDFSKECETFAPGRVRMHACTYVSVYV